MSGFLCTMVGATFAVAAAAEVLRSKVGVTTTGTAQVDTAQYKFGGASGLFTTGLIKPQTQVLSYGTNNLTIEFWMRLASLPNPAMPIGTRALGNTLAAGEWQLVSYSTGQLQFNLRSLNIQSSTNVSVNTWFHLAITRSGNTFTMYLNGTNVGSGTESGNFADKETFIGGTGDGGLLVGGHIDEFRISNSARYTANFTAPTAAFVNDENTLLLLHMDGTDASTVFEDDNGVRSKKGITAIATAQVDTAQSKFGGASALFNASSLDHLFIKDNSGSNNITTDWTFECWHRPNARSGTVFPVILANHFDTWASGDWGFFDRHNAASTKWSFFINAYDANNPTLVSTTSVSNGTWYHLAVVKQGTTYKLFVNGVEEDSETTSAAIATNRDLRIGSSGNATSKTINGHLDEVRVSNTARYTSNFTPQTQPFVNDANTLLLLHMDGTDAVTYFEDDNGASTPGRTQKHISYFGNAQIDTAQSKFGGASYLGDGTGDYLDFAPASFSGDFTFEGWIRFAAVPTTGQFQMIGSSSSTTNRYFSYTNNGGTLRFETGISGTGSFYQWWNHTLSINTWYHFAFIKNSTTLSVYIDGTALSSSGTSGTMTTDKHLFNDAVGRIGAWYNTANSVNGHIDELRISNTARYTAAFTPQTTAFQDDANTLLLLHFDGADAATVFTDDIGGRSKIGFQGNGAVISSTQSKFNGTSIFFDNTNDIINGSFSQGTDLTTGDWTIECWAYPTNMVGVMMATAKDGTNEGWWFGLNPNVIRFLLGSTTGGIGAWDSNANTVTENAWNHLAVCHTGGVLSFFANGAKVRTDVTLGFTPKASTIGVKFGQGNGISSGTYSDTASGLLYYGGYLTECRISNSVRYTGSTYVTPTTQFQNDANTTLLLHGNGTVNSTVFTDDNGVPPDYDYGA